MFEDVYNMLNRAKNLSESDAFRFAVNEDAKKLIIKLNTISQLYNEGIDSEEVSLGRYSDFTIEAKIFKNERFDHITLKDEGDFYNSFRVEVNSGDITILADDSGKYDIPLTEKYGKDIIGLTDENIAILADKMLPRYREYAIKNILG